MAQTKKKRRRKHRGTQGGSISTKPRGRPQNRAEARARAGQRSKKRKQTGPVLPKAPTWNGAIMKGAIAGLIFFALLALAFGRPVGASAGLAAFMLVFYVPMSYLTDRFFYRRRMRDIERARQEKADRRKQT